MEQRSLGVSVLRGDPLRVALMSLDPCAEAMQWLKGKPLDANTLAELSPDWRKWLTDALGVSRDASAERVREALLSGSGYGDGYGSGSGYGDGSGSGSGYGDGYGSGSGSGYGYGYGDGDGSGYGSGSGYGDGDGSGYGDGDGSGSGSGDGS